MMLAMMFFTFNGVNIGHDHGDYDGHDLYLVVGEDDNNGGNDDDGDDVLYF